MYTHYFGLQEKPFAITPNPRYLFMSELHHEAIAHLLHGIHPEGCIALFTGDVGTGKTTVCRFLLEKIPTTTNVALVLNPKVSFSEMLNTICFELGIPINHADSVKARIDVLNEHLLTSHSLGKSTVVIIDEAQNLDFEILEQLRLLTNLETNTHKLLQIIFIGQPELRTTMLRSEMSQLSQRITTKYHLNPLRSTDVKAYIFHRLTVAGASAPEKMFTYRSIQIIAKKTQGVPRLINTLCDRSLLGAYVENKTIVTSGVAKRAASEIFSPPQNRLSTGRRITSFLVILALITSFFLFFPGDTLTTIFRSLFSINQVP